MKHLDALMKQLPEVLNHAIAQLKKPPKQVHLTVVGDFGGMDDCPVASDLSIALEQDGDDIALELDLPPFPIAGTTSLAAASPDFFTDQMDGGVRTDTEFTLALDWIMFAYADRLGRFAAGFAPPVVFNGALGYQIAEGYQQGIRDLASKPLATRELVQATLALFTDDVDPTLYDRVAAGAESNAAKDPLGFVDTLAAMRKDAPSQKLSPLLTDLYQSGRYKTLLEVKTKLAKPVTLQIMRDGLMDRAQPESPYNAYYAYFYDGEAEAEGDDPYYGARQYFPLFIVDGGKGFVLVDLASETAELQVDDRTGTRTPLMPLAQFLTRLA